MKSISNKKLITDNKRNYVGYIKIPIWFVSQYVKYKDGTKIEVKDNAANYFYVLKFRYDENKNKVVKELYYQDDLSPMNFRKINFQGR